YITLRHLRLLVRQPWYIAFTLVQPIMWLTLYGELFKRVVEIPGFNATSYISYLAPGIVIMTAMMSSGWNGMGVIRDLDRGVMDRFLASPVSRIAIITGRMTSMTITILIQCMIIVVLGLVRGARFAGGAPGVLVLMGCAVMLAASFGALSIGMALM